MQNANPLNLYVLPVDNQPEQHKVNLQRHHPLIMLQNKKANLTSIKWAHSVNCQRDLEESLKSDIDMIEADIQLGKLNNAGDDMPIMAHPPNTTSDLSLQEFLSQITIYNEGNPDLMKGVKLDFKSIAAFEDSLDILREMIPMMTCPVWLNADIIIGPGGDLDSEVVDPKRFLEGCAEFKSAMLSIGWTTEAYGEYTPEQMDDMLQALKDNKISETGQPITFPVRAGLAANSQKQLHDLMRVVNKTNECTLTIWGQKDDYTDVEKVRQLIFSFGFDRVYLDVPEDLANQLDLDRNDNNGGLMRMPSLLTFSVICVCVVLASFWLKRAHF